MLKPRKGMSFFLKVRNQYAFCIVLSAKSDEDGEYKIVRTPFHRYRDETLRLSLSEIAFYHFDETLRDGSSVEEWDSNAVRSITRKTVQPKISEDVEVISEGQKSFGDDFCPSEDQDESVELDL